MFNIFTHLETVVKKEKKVETECQKELYRILPKKEKKNLKQNLFPIKVGNSEKQRECQAFFSV